MNLSSSSAASGAFTIATESTASSMETMMSLSHSTIVETFRTSTSSLISATFPSDLGSATTVALLSPSQASPSTTQTTISGTTSTSSVATTTAPAIAPVKPPNWGEAPNALLEFTMYLKTAIFTADLNDPLSPRFQTLALEIEIKVNAAFYNCLGFIRNSAKVIEFRSGSIDANYTVSYYGEAVITNNTEINQYITEVVYPNITSLVIDGSNVTADNMTTQSMIQLNIAAEDPCSVATDSVCDPCYKCANAPATYVECRYGCNMDYQRCTILDNTGPIAHYSCSCKENYLPVGNDCVHENIIIGVSVGVGAALILALIIALVVVGCKYRRKFKKQKDHFTTEPSTPVGLPFQPVFGDDANGSGAEVRIGEPSNTPTFVPATQDDLVTFSREDETMSSSYDSSVQETEGNRQDVISYDDFPQETRQSEAFDSFHPSLLGIDTTTQYFIKRARLPKEPVDLVHYKDFDSSFF